MRHNPRMRKRTIKRLCIHEALVFRNIVDFDGRNYTERWVCIGKFPARFYTMTRSETSTTSISRTTPTNGGKQDYTPPFKVLLSTFDVSTKDKLIPVVDGKLAMNGTLSYEVNSPPINPALMDMMCEVPIELSMLSFKILTSENGTDILELEGEDLKDALDDIERLAIEWSESDED